MTTTRIPRLSLEDQLNLAVEAPGSPINVAAVATLAGALNVTVHADARAVPDLPVLLAAIRREWDAESAGQP